MEAQFYGANCIRLSTKQASIVIDDNLTSLGQKDVLKADEVALFTFEPHAPASQARLVIDQPGEYEVSDVSIQGIAARSHMGEEGDLSAIIYKLVIGEIRVAVLGHIHPSLNEAQLEAIGTVDVLFVPVGNSGYTLDAVGALQVIKKIEPKVVVPTHYANKDLKFEVPQKDLAEALKELAMEPKETVPKLKLKAADLPELAELIVLERQ